MGHRVFPRCHYPIREELTALLFLREKAGLTQNVYGLLNHLADRIEGRQLPLILLTGECYREGIFARAFESWHKGYRSKQPQILSGHRAEVRIRVARKDLLHCWNLAFVAHKT